MDISQPHTAWQVENRDGVQIIAAVVPTYCFRVHYMRGWMARTSKHRSSS
jgi:hypothetical protein